MRWRRMLGVRLWKKQASDLHRMGTGMAKPLNVAIIGAGLAGLATAAALRQVGIDVTVYQQAKQFVRLTFADGATVTADAVIGADGVHSVVRDILFDTAPVTYTGRIAYRTTYPASLLNGGKIDDCTKWWGEDRHIVIYYVKPDRSEIYLVTSQPEPEFRIESWSAKGDVKELRKAFAGFDRQVEPVLAACPDVHKWAIVDRNSLERWGERNVTLLGDACHPMTPYMAQGAAMAIEDAAVLSRCLDGAGRDGIADAFRRFETTRKERTSRVQATSRANTWLKQKTDADWVYAYDAWTVPLAA